MALDDVPFCREYGGAAVPAIPPRHRGFRGGGSGTFESFLELRLFDLLRGPRGHWGTIPGLRSELLLGYL